MPVQSTARDCGHQLVKRATAAANSCKASSAPAANSSKASSVPAASAGEWNNALDPETKAWATPKIGYRVPVGMKNYHGAGSHFPLVNNSSFSNLWHSSQFLADFTTFSSMLFSELKSHELMLPPSCRSFLWAKKSLYHVSQAFQLPSSHPNWFCQIFLQLWQNSTVITLCTTWTLQAEQGKAPLQILPNQQFYLHSCQCSAQPPSSIPNNGII